MEEAPLDTGTIVKLEGLDARIRERFPKRLQAIASNIVAHFFRRLSRNDAIECFLEDDWDGARTDLKEYCQKMFVLQQQSEDIDVLGKAYTVTHVRCTPRAAQKHEVLYCAEGRVVCGKDLAATVTTTKSQLFGDQGEFYYAAYLEGPVLDLAARTDRMSFDLPEDDADRLVDPEAAEHPSIKRLHDAVTARAREFLKDVLDPLETKHKTRIEAYCRNNVIFRPLLKHRMDAMLRIPMGLDDSEFAIQIQRVYNEWKMSARDRFRQMAKTVRDNSQVLDERRTAYQELLRDMSQIAYYELASYVIDRRAVIEFLWERLRRNPDGKFTDEDAIHDVFFPRKQTSDDVAWDESNLWLVDERLAYLQYVASDIALRKHGTIESDSRERPDVAIYYDRDFDLTFAFADGEIPFTSVSLLEFKKPERTKYTEEENPVNQAIRYIREIRAAKVATQDGHTFRVDDHTPIVIHAICHIVKELIPFLQAYPYFDSPDGQGILIQLPRMNATIQIVTFEKLIADARKRNDVFFRKLGVDVLPG